MKLLIILPILMCVLHLTIVKSGKIFLGTNQKYYYISHPLKNNWWQAGKYCKYFNMSLIEITSEMDEQAIQEIIQSPEYKGLAEPFFWTGATDQGSEGNFYWVHSGQPVIFSNWARGQPDDYLGNEDCVEIRGFYNYLWNDDQCSEQKYFICDVNYVNGKALMDFDSNSINSTNLSMLPLP